MCGVGWVGGWKEKSLLLYCKEWPYALACVCSGLLPAVPDPHKPGPVPSKGRFEHDRVVSVGQEEERKRGEREVFRCAREL